MLIKNDVFIYWLFLNVIILESLNTLDSILNEQSVTKDTVSTGEVVPSAPKFETDYIQFMDNNQMLLTCRECAKMFTTLEVNILYYIYGCFDTNYHL